MVLLESRVVRRNLFLVNLGLLAHVLFTSERRRVAPVERDHLLLGPAQVESRERNDVVDVPDVAVEEVFRIAVGEPLEVLVGRAAEVIDALLTFVFVRQDRVDAVAHVLLHLQHRVAVAVLALLFVEADHTVLLSGREFLAFLLLLADGADARTLFVLEVVISLHILCFATVEANISLFAKDVYVFCLGAGVADLQAVGMCLLVVTVVAHLVLALDEGSRNRLLADGTHAFTVLTLIVLLLFRLLRLFVAFGVAGTFALLANGAMFDKK